MSVSFQNKSETADFANKQLSWNQTRNDDHSL